LNARISDRSYSRYLRFAWFYKKIFSKVDKVFAQSEKDKERLQSLGAVHVSVVGNIKAFQEISVTRHFHKPQNKEVITFASTHEGEEAVLLKHLSHLENQIWIIVPRHPERFDQVALLAAEYAAVHGLSFHRFSEKEDFDSDIVLVDKMGELINIYAISDCVLLGGSFVPDVGGHNPLEPAYFQTKIISGKHIYNQEALFPLVDHVQFCDAQDLPKVIPLTQATNINAKADMMPILEELNGVV